MSFASLTAIGLVASLATPVSLTHSGDATEVIKTTMTIAGWDAELATENGYQLSLTSDGLIESTFVGDDADLILSEAAVEASENTAATSGNPSTVYGPCGESYIFIDQSGLGLEFVTGYLLYDTSALSHIWNVTTTDNFGSTLDYWDLSGVPLEVAPWQWQGARDFANSKSGSWVAEVFWGYTLNENGSLCFSGNPSDSWGR